MVNIIELISAAGLLLGICILILYAIGYIIAFIIMSFRCRDFGDAVFGLGGLMIIISLITYSFSSLIS